MVLRMELMVLKAISHLSDFMRKTTANFGLIAVTDDSDRASSGDK